MSIDFREARQEDFFYCRSLYFAHLETVAPEQEASFRERWIVPEVKIITRDGVDVGWRQTRIEDGALFLVQLFLEGRFQGQGIGTLVLRSLMSDASRAAMPMTLGVVKSNPARRLYDRLGFRVTHEDDRKFYMRYDHAEDAPY